MAIEYFHDVYKATEGQTKFKTSRVFIPGSITVTLNGIVMNLGEDHEYVELDSQHINFNTPLYEGDVVAIKNAGTNEHLNVDVVGYTGALFPLYGKSQHIMFNSLYKIRIKLKDKMIEWGFTGRYSPMFTNARKVRSITGGLFDEIKDEQINYLIYLNSKEIDIMQTGELDEASLEYYKLNWVLYKTAIDLITAIYLTMSGQVGSVNKTIGPVSVGRTYKIPFIKDMLERFNGILDKYTDSLIQTNRAQNFVKAGSTAYPYNKRVMF